MLRFQIHPLASPGEPIEVVGHDAAPVLNMIERLGCREAAVARDGAYAFSVRLDESGLWTIYQSEPVNRVSTHG